MDQTWDWPMKLELQMAGHHSHNSHTHQLEHYGQVQMISDPNQHCQIHLVEQTAVSSHHKVEDNVPIEVDMNHVAGNHNLHAVLGKLLELSSGAVSLTREPGSFVGCDQKVVMP